MREFHSSGQPLDILDFLLSEQYGDDPTRKPTRKPFPHFIPGISQYTTDQAKPIEIPFKNMFRDKHGDPVDLDFCESVDANG